MRIFVAYSYRSDDSWIEDLVFELIRALADEPVSGKEIFGQSLDDEVRTRIASCDAMIAFTTRREQISGTDLWTTHDWVQDELVTALTKDIPLVEVRDVKVKPHSGMLSSRARINYDNNRAECLLNITQTICSWHRQEGSDRSVKRRQAYTEKLIRLVPVEFIAAYIMIMNAFSSLGIQPIWMWHLGSALVLIPLLFVYQWKQLKISNWRQHAVTIISFILWVLNISEITRSFITWPLLIYGVILFFWTLLSPLLFQ